MTARQPQVSVVLAVHNAQEVLSRTVESVLNQDFRALELLIVDCSSTDHTLANIQRFAERDIRVEVLHQGTNDKAAGRDAALEAARGAFVLFMDQGDWLSPSYLEHMLKPATEMGFQLVSSALSIDATNAKGDRSSVSLAPVAQSWTTAADFHKGMGALLTDGGLCNVAGKLMQRSRICSLGLRFTQLDTFDWAISYLEEVERACILQKPVYHVSYTLSAEENVVDLGRYQVVENHHAHLLQLYHTWGIDTDAASMESVHRLHLSEVIRCISNVSTASGKLSTAERHDYVQRMIDAPATQASIEALRPASKDFGFMFTPIARRSATACCVGARIQDMVDRTFAPFVSTRMVYR